MKRRKRDREEPDTGRHLCPRCDGRGVTIDPESHLFGRCGACDGDGTVPRSPKFSQSTPTAPADDAAP